MIRKNRGVIFGTQGMTRGKQTLNANSMLRRQAQADAPTQFGRSTATHKPVFGGRARSVRRR